MSAIDPTARIASGAKLGRNVTVGAYCTIGANVSIGDDCRLDPHVHIAGHTVIGPRTKISPFASLGTEPQSVHYKDEPTRLVVGADCVIREYVTMNIGTGAGRGVTTVGDKCFFMANSHVGHDAIVGNNVYLANSVALGGFSEVGDHVFFGGLAAMQQFSRIGVHAMVGGAVFVTRDIAPFTYAIGHRPQLAGINRLGLKRRGFSAQGIRDIRKAYLAIFEGAGTLAERVAGAAKDMAGNENAMLMVEFVRASMDKKRPLALPRRGASGDQD